MTHGRHEAAGERPRESPIQRAAARGGCSEEVVSEVPSRRKGKGRSELRVAGDEHMRGQQVVAPATPLRGYTEEDVSEITLRWDGTG